MVESGSILRGARIYLSGPMDFVASRSEEKRVGWRTRVRQFLKQFGAIVYDPWAKPIIVGQDGYGKDYEYVSNKRAEWTFQQSEAGRDARASLCQLFYPTVHINWRMVDICDFLIAYCPTNIYSVGTVNEIVRARSQHKPVLFVSPPVLFPALNQLEEHLTTKKDLEGLALLEQTKMEASLKPNPGGVPSPWYLALMQEDYFFDGFGFHLYPQLKEQGNWTLTRLDEIEHMRSPQKPLFPYLEKLNKEIPKCYDSIHQDYVDNSDWMLLKPDVHEIVG